MDARITEFSGNDAAILAQNPATLDAAGQANYKNVKRFHDAPLQMSAPHLANLWTRYDFDARRAPGPSCRRRRQLRLRPDAPARQPPIRPPDLRAAQRDGRLLVDVAASSRDLEFMGKNLADEHYRPSQSTRSRPREFLVTLRGNF